MTASTPDVPVREPAALVELFAGLGCVTRGFLRSGAFMPALLTDIDAAAEAAWRANQLPGEYLRRPVADVTAMDVLNVMDGRPVAGLLGCPPCQGWSSAGARNYNDERNALLIDYFRFVEALKPAFFVMENVPRALQSSLLREALEGPAEDYVVWSGVLNAALYGVPQSRQRAIVIGYRRDLECTPTAPVPTHGGRGVIFDYGLQRLVRPDRERGAGALGLYAELGRPSHLDADAARLLVAPAGETEELVTVGAAIGDLPPAQDNDAVTPYTGGEPSPYAAALRVGADGVRNHRRWRHREPLVERLQSVPEGGGLPELAGRARSRRYFSQAYSRLHRQGLARTLTTNFHNPGCGRFLHYAETRSITVREAMRLQGIEDRIVLEGDATVQERLVGNAFPLPLAEALGRHVAEQLDGVLAVAA